MPPTQRSVVRNETVVPNAGQAGTETEQLRARLRAATLEIGRLTVSLEEMQRVSGSGTAQTTPESSSGAAEDRQLRALRYSLLVAQREYDADCRELTTACNALRGRISVLTNAAESSRSGLAAALQHVDVLKEVVQQSNTVGSSTAAARHVLDSLAVALRNAHAALPTNGTGNDSGPYATRWGADDGRQQHPFDVSLLRRRDAAVTASASPMPPVTMPPLKATVITPPAAEAALTAACAELEGRLAHEQSRGRKLEEELSRWRRTAASVGDELGIRGTSDPSALIAALHALRHSSVVTGSVAVNNVTATALDSQTHVPRDNDSDDRGERDEDGGADAGYRSDVIKEEKRLRSGPGGKLPERRPSEAAPLLRFVTAPAARRSPELHGRQAIPTPSGKAVSTASSSLQNTAAPTLSQHTVHVGGASASRRLKAAGVGREARPLQPRAVVVAEDTSSSGVRDGVKRSPVTALRRQPRRVQRDGHGDDHAAKLRLAPIMDAGRRQTAVPQPGARGLSPVRAVVAELRDTDASDNEEAPPAMSSRAAMTPLFGPSGTRNAAVLVTSPSALGGGAALTTTTMPQADTVRAPSDDNILRADDNLVSTHGDAVDNLLRRSSAQARRLTALRAVEREQQQDSSIDTTPDITTRPPSMTSSASTQSVMKAAAINDRLHRLRATAAADAATGNHNSDLPARDESEDLLGDELGTAMPSSTLRGAVGDISLAAMNEQRSRDTKGSSSLQHNTPSADRVASDNGIYAVNTTSAARQPMTSLPSAQFATHAELSPPPSSISNDSIEAAAEAALSTSVAAAPVAPMSTSSMNWAEQPINDHAATTSKFHGQVSIGPRITSDGTWGGSVGSSSGARDSVSASEQGVTMTVSSASDATQAINRDLAAIDAEIAGMHASLARAATALGEQRRVAKMEASASGNANNRDHVNIGGVVPATVVRADAALARAARALAAVSPRSASGASYRTGDRSMRDWAFSSASSSVLQPVVNTSGRSVAENSEVNRDYDVDPEGLLFLQQARDTQRDTATQSSYHSRESADVEVLLASLAKGLQVPLRPIVHTDMAYGNSSAASRAQSSSRYSESQHE